MCFLKNLPSDYWTWILEGGYNTHFEKVNIKQEQQQEEEMLQGKQGTQNEEFSEF